MPADVDVLVAGNSPIRFSSEYLPFESGSHDYDASPEVLTPEPPKSVFRPGNSPLDFPTALGSPTHFTFHGRCGSPTLRPVPSAAVALAENLNHLRLVPPDAREPRMPVAVPRRPCLVVRCDVLDLRGPSRSKKRVVFADDRGFPLALVRTMTEPSDVPPRWSLQFLAQATQGASVDPAPEPWEVTFPQPASDYLDFRRRLDTNNVSLENVIVKESEQSVVGTVKVRNLAFQKEVFVRTSSDDWATQEDALCTHVPGGAPALGVAVLYDTFSFRLALPPDSRKVEFCVCYRCSGLEYWDNHSGKNYFIRKKEHARPADPPPGRGISLSRRFSDDVKANARLESWSEFATWNHLNNDAPYW